MVRFAGPPRGLRLKALVVSAAAFGQEAPGNRRALDSLLRAKMLVPTASCGARQPLSLELWGCPLSLGLTGQGDGAGLSPMVFSTSTLIRQSFLKMVCGSHVFLHGTLWGKGLGSAGPGTALTDYPRSSWNLSTHPQLGHVLTAFSLQTWLRDGLSDGLVVG